MNRGEIWSYRFKSPDKRRPVLVLTRQEVIGLLRTVMVAPVTSTIRGAPSEVALGVEEGLKHVSAVRAHAQGGGNLSFATRLWKRGSARRGSKPRSTLR